MGEDSAFKISLRHLPLIDMGVQLVWVSVRLFLSIVGLEVVG
jgi:hypothetical protein